MSNYQNEQSQEQTDSSGLRQAAYDYAKEQPIGKSLDAKNTIDKGNDDAITKAADKAEDVKNATSSASNIAETAESAGAAEAAGAGTSAAAGASTAGVSLIVQAALYAVNKTKNEINSLNHLGTAEDDYKSNSFLIVLILFFPFLILFCTIVLKGTPGSTENYKETSYSYNLEEHQRGSIQKEFAAIRLEEYEGDNPLENAAKAYIYGVDESTGLRNALHDAITEECNSIVENLGHRTLGRFFQKYDRSRSLEYFYANPWPYDLQIGNETDYFPTIGNIMGKGGYAYYEPTYDDVNFAEMLSVLSQNPEYNWEECRYEEFNEYIRSDTAKNLYYELDVDWIVVYKAVKEYLGEDGLPHKEEYFLEFEVGSEEEVRDKEEEFERDGLTYRKDSYYCKTEVKPFGLRALYMLANISPESEHVDFYRHTNSEMLDYHEYLIRLYLRNVKDIAGPAYNEQRSSSSTIYTALAEEYGTARGRSAWYYIENPYNYNAISGTNPLPDYLKNLTDKELELILKELLEIDGSKQLQMMAYINQGWFKNALSNGVKLSKSGCMYTSMYMILQYYTGINLSTEEIYSLSEKYVGNDAMFQTSTFLNDFGMQQSDNINGYSNFVKGVQENINASQPVLVHIRGYWANSDTGDVYHSSTNGHFLVAVGYDEEGVYVNDPGSQANTNSKIPWEEWANVSDLYYREVTPK